MAEIIVISVKKNQTLLSTYVQKMCFRKTF